MSINVRAQAGELVHGLPRPSAHSATTSNPSMVEGDPRQACPDDGLVVNESGSDHRPPISPGQPAAHPPAVAGGACLELPAERRPRVPACQSAHAPPFSLRGGGGYDRYRPVCLGHDRDAYVGELDPEHGPSTRRVASRIRERLLRDPVGGKADARRDAGEISLHAQLD